MIMDEARAWLKAILEEAEACHWCDQPGTTQYLGRRACEAHENLLQQWATEDVSRPASPFGAADTGFDWEGED